MEDGRFKKHTTEELTPHQVDILKVIVDGPVTEISYSHPEMQLGELARGRVSETLNSLGGLESIFNVLRLDPTLKFKRRFGFSSPCGYVVNLDKARALYGSYLGAQGKTSEGTR